MGDQTPVEVQSQPSEVEVKKQLNSVTPKDGVLILGSAEVDLAKALPLTLGDMRRLEALGLVTQKGDLQVTGMDGIAKILHLLVQKVNKDIPLETLDSLAVSKVTRAFLFIQRQIMEGEPDLGPTKSS